MKAKVKHEGDSWQLTAEVHNTGTSPALMVCIKAVRDKTGDPIQPALYDDNYIALMPGESRTLHVSLLNADTRGEKPRLVLHAFGSDR
jgi:hypothetical protein